MMKLISRLLIALALLSTGSLAMADQHHGKNNHHDSQRSSSHRGDDHKRGHGDHYRSDRDHDRRHFSDRHRYRHLPPHYYRHNYRHGYRYPAPRYVVRHNRWARGHRYYGPNYVVSNYGHYRLRQPPRGYHWIRADNNYLLVAIATGVILDIALH
jgi:Ni/Co efflux regulator RcnB